MKTLKSKWKDIEFELGLSTGPCRIKFVDNKATMKNEAADAILSLRPDGITELSIDGAFTKGDKILFVRDTGMGDILLTTPIIRKLHEMGVVIDYAVNKAHVPILEHNPFINKVIPLEGFQWRVEDYACVIDMRRVSENAEAGGFKGHRIEAFADAVDIPVTESDFYLNYYPTADELLYGQEQIKEFKEIYDKKKVVGFGWAASYPQRNLSDARKVSLIMALLYKGYGVAVLHDAKIDCPEYQAISGMGGLVSFAGDLSLRETAGLMYNLDAMITPDTGLLHLAAALNVPTVAFMGPFPKESRCTIMDKLEVLNEPETCGLFSCRSYFCKNKSQDGTVNCLTIDNSKFLKSLEEIIN